MSELKAHHIVKAPILSEESQIQQAKGNQYTFRVDPRANKHQIRDAIEAMFKHKNIQVVRVNTMNYDGKVKNQLGRGGSGRRPNWKKAIVTLRPGDSLDLI